MLKDGHCQDVTHLASINYDTAVKFHRDLGVKTNVGKFRPRFDIEDHFVFTKNQYANCDWPSLKLNYPAYLKQDEIKRKLWKCFIIITLRVNNSERKKKKIQPQIL